MEGQATRNNYATENQYGSLLQAGLLVAETEFALQVESDIAPYKGLLMGLFFMTVGMEISVGLFFAEWKTVVSGIVLLIGGKVTLSLFNTIRKTHILYFLWPVMTMCVDTCADTCTICCTVSDLLCWALVLAADRLLYPKECQHFGCLWLCLT